MRIRAVSIVAVLLTALLSASCGGNDKDSSNAVRPQAFDPTNADALARAALLVAIDLPGVGWKATDDKFAEDPDELTSCKELNSLRGDARTSAVGRATRELARRGSNAGPYVHSEVYIYRDPVSGDDLLRRYKAIDSGTGFLSCYEAELKELFEGNGRATIKRVPASGKAPNGGLSVAVELELAAAGTLNLRSEDYFWTSGNATIAVTISAVKTNFSPDLVRAAITKAKNSADDAARGKRQAVTEAEAGN